jgi:outer membrane protein assembly factor BamB
MKTLKKLQPIKASTIGLLWLCLASSSFSVPAQENTKTVGRAKTLDLSLALKPCLQIYNNKIVSAGYASDNEKDFNKEALFVSFQSGKFGRLDLPKKSLTWLSDLGGEIISDLVSENKTVYLITKIVKAEPKKSVEFDNQSINYILWSINAATGITNWQFPFTSKARVFLNNYRGKIFLTDTDGIIYSIKNFDTPKIANKNLAFKFSSPPVFFENKIYIGAEDNSILTVSFDEAEIVSKIPAQHSPASVLVVTGDKLLWGDKKGFVNLVDTRSNNRIWSVRNGGEISSLTFVPHGVLVSSLDNFVYLISLQKGKKVWKTRLAGRISVKPLIAGNFVVLFTAAADNAFILDLRNGKIINQISLTDKGFILQTPAIINNLLVFPTNKGIFAFAEVSADCTQN